MLHSRQVPTMGPGVLSFSPNQAITQNKVI